MGEEPRREDFHKNTNYKTWWLIEDAQDMQFRDQFVIRYTKTGHLDATKDMCEIMWNDPLRTEGCVPCYSGEAQIREDKVMTRKFVTWSPKGPYLTTFHDNGIMLWAGMDWDACAR